MHSMNLCKCKLVRTWYGHTSVAMQIFVESINLNTISLRELSIWADPIKMNGAGARADLLLNRRSQQPVSPRDGY
ncbi:hypothetical protein XELAEV_18025772mg [Xenopus laevis]|uniref:Uncharacterized protein n=1 Tax=Xenopus laevis TaxID=8355 RepID=A0A974D2Z8_XENLA|nr:hypothetical protein XELAEV_18025772mg [Xenopus laevis]